MQTTLFLSLGHIRHRAYDDHVTTVNSEVPCITGLMPLQSRISNLLGYTLVQQPFSTQIWFSHVPWFYKVAGAK